MPAIKYPFIQKGMLFTNSLCNNLYVMTGEPLHLKEKPHDNQLFNSLRESNTVRANNYKTSDLDVFERFDVNSLQQLVELDFYLVSTDGELTEIKR